MGAGKAEGGCPALFLPIILFSDAFHKTHWPEKYAPCRPFPAGEVLKDWVLTGASANKYNKRGHGPFRDHKGGVPMAGMCLSRKLEETDMKEHYSRNIPALTEGECALLRSKRVLVVGCGGLGGHIIDLLTRVGVGSLRVVDGDVFEPTNLNRQLLSDTAVLGRPKAEVAAEHIRRVSPDTQAEAVNCFMTEENARELIRDCDLVMDALDSIGARRILAQACADSGIPYVYGAVQGWVAQAAVSMPGDGLIRRLFPQKTEIPDKSVLSFTPALCASVQTALAVKLLVGRPVRTGVIYHLDLLDQEFEVIPMA